MKTIKDVFEEHGKRLKIDKKLASQIQQFNISWLSRGEHLAFVTGYTIGEQKLVWSANDEYSLFTDICNMDSREVRKDVLKITSKGPGGQVLNNHKYYLLTWLQHKFITDTKMKLEDRLAVVEQLYLVFAYMKMSSLHNSSRFAKYTPSENLAIATYEKLSNDFIIKKYGTWAGVFKNVAKRFMPRNRDFEVKEAGVHFPRITRCNDDDMSRVSMDNSTTLTNYMGSYYNVMRQMEAQGVDSGITSLIIEGEDDTRIAEIEDNPTKYVNYLKTIASLPSDFSRPKLIHVISNIMGNLDDESLRKTLVHMSNNYHKNTLEYNKLFETTIIFGINYLSSRGKHGDDLTEQIEATLEYMRGRWVSAKGQSQDIYEFKDVGRNIVLEATGKRSKPFLITTTIGLGLYLFLRGIVNKTI